MSFYWKVKSGIAKNQDKILQLKKKSFYRISSEISKIKG